RAKVPRHARPALARTRAQHGAGAELVHSPQARLRIRKRCARSAADRAGRTTARERSPAGIDARRFACATAGSRETAQGQVARSPTLSNGSGARAVATIGRRMSRGGRPAVHQVLATLGYGDAIGHEVMAIQRVLRGAGYESDVFVETADRRLESQTRDYRELVDASDATNLLLHHFSIGSKASRTAYALPDRMALIYHNITPPEYFIGIHRTLARQCFRGRRELGAYTDRVDLAIGDSEFNRKDLEGLGFQRTAVLPVVPGFS